MTENIVDFPDRERIAEEAAAWLIRLDGDEPLSGIEQERLREWMAQSRRHREELRELAKQWNRLNVLTELAVPLDHPHGGTSGGKPGAFRFAVIAAAVAVLGVALGALLLTRLEPPPSSAADGLYATAIGQQRTTTLVDGSVVVLNTNTQIEVDYGEAFRDIRLLQGEAHFTVARDTARPFRVHAGDERIEATGTAFLVHIKDDGIDVAVTEGSVALKSMTRGVPEAPATRREIRNRAPGGTADLGQDRYDQLLGTLEAGQLATIRSTVDRAAERVSTLEAVRELRAEDMARRLSWRSGVLLFTGETLSQAVREISRYTAVSIEIADPEVGEIRIGGRFPVGETEKMFAALETNFGLEVTHLDPNHVVVSARAD